MISRFLRPQSKTIKSINKQLKYSYFNQPQNFDANKDYYRILQLNKEASEADIKRSYYRMAKLYHPDVSKGYDSKFKQISQAYEVLSNQNTKKQYDSARVFREGWSKMGSKAQQGTYSYQQYQNVFYSMSPEERQQFQRQAQARLRRFGLFLGGFFLFWLVFSRTPHKAYTQFNGTLIPIEPQVAFQYPDPYLQQPNPYSQMGGHSPYGQPNNPYANQPYAPPLNYGGQPTEQYGSQYPQAQYLNQYNQYKQPPQPNPAASQPQVSYSQTQYNQPQQKSQYKIDRPQPHQPYPNSGYAEKPIQANYQPGYKTETPKGLED